MSLPWRPPPALTLRIPPAQPYNELPARFARVKPSGDTLALLNALLTYDPLRRITARDAKQHDYFRSRPLAQVLPRPAPWRMPMSGRWVQ